MMLAARLFFCASVAAGVVRGAEATSLAPPSLAFEQGGTGDATVRPFTIFDSGTLIASTRDSVYVNQKVFENILSNIKTNSVELEGDKPISYPSTYRVTYRAQLETKWFALTDASVTSIMGILVKYYLTSGIDVPPWILAIEKEP